MWIIYPKIIFACAWLADLSPNCSTLSVLLNFKNTSHRFYNNQWPSILINSNKIFDSLRCFKGIRCNKLEIDFNIGGCWLGHLDFVTHPDINPVQQSLTLVNRREPVFFKGNRHQLFCHISFSKEEQFSTKFFEESFFCVPNYIIISLQVTSPRTMKTTSLTRIYSNCLQSFIRSSTLASGIPVYRPGSSCFSSTPCWFTQKILAIKLNTRGKASWAQVHPGTGSSYLCPGHRPGHKS